MKKLVFIFTILFICTLCPNKTISKNAPANVKKGSYSFYYKSVKKAVKNYLGKKGDELTKTDLKKLLDLKCFIVEDSVRTLKDIPKLFPRLKYISIMFDKAVSKEDCIILSHMQKLKEVSIYSPIIPSIDFSKKLSYVEISYDDNACLSKKNNLAAFSVLGENFIKKNIKGHINKYVKVVEDNHIFELIGSDYTYDNKDSKLPSNIYERKVFVSDISKGRPIYNTTLNASVDLGDCASNRLCITDVNFDGIKDILVNNGHYGTQGLVTYTCFLNHNNKYSLCGSFAGIANPAIDEKNKKVLSCWRNWAASHSWAMYSYIGGKYIMVSCLTEEPDKKASQKDKEVWSYRVEKLINGKMRQTGFYSRKSYTEKQIQEMFFRKDSYWGLFSDKWGTLNNRGSYKDFSIYGNEYIDSTIFDIINN